jgi:hypothetical protein
MTRVGGYDLLGRVGEGSAATVWKAHDRDLDRFVALKELDASTREQRARWQAEARTLAAIDEAHVVRVYGYVESETRAYIVQEWVEGATLAAVLARSGRLTTAQALGGGPRRPARPRPRLLRRHLHHGIRRPGPPRVVRVGASTVRAPEPAARDALSRHSQGAVVVRLLS